MTTPSMISTRRFSASMRLKLQVAFAKAWEALVETYRLQAAEFVQRVLPSLSVDEALDRYFREVGVPAGMVEAVRARALITLAPVIEQATGDGDAEEPAAPRVSLRLDHLVGALRQRVQYVEETNLQCRLAACVADEAIAAAHVRMAVEVAALLSAELSPDEAIMHYVRTFNLPALEAQIIFQRAMAQWAERYAPRPDAVAPSRDGTAECANRPRLELAPVASFGLRARALV